MTALLAAINVNFTYIVKVTLLLILVTGVVLTALGLIFGAEAVAPMRCATRKPC